MNKVFKRFGIKLINLTVESKKNSQIGLAALFNVLKNSKYQPSISKKWIQNQEGSNFLNNNLEQAVKSLSITLNIINYEQAENKRKILKKEKEKALLNTTDEDIQERIKNVYFN